MKRLVAALLLGLSFAAHGQVTISDVTLLNAQDPGNIWITSSNVHWILGLSSQPNGPLLNSATSSVSGIAQGDYWLFADPANLGTQAQLSVNFSDGSSLTTLFQVTGTNGTAQSWSRISGSTNLALGWAQGSIDLVGTYGGINPDGVGDLYMKASITSPVPEAPTMLLFALGGAGLLYGRRRDARSLV